MTLRPDQFHFFKFSSFNRMSTVIVFALFCIMALVLACKFDPDTNTAKSDQTKEPGMTCGCSGKSTPSTENTPQTGNDTNNSTNNSASSNPQASTEDLLELLRHFYELNTVFELVSLNVVYDFNMTGYEEAHKLPTVFVATHSDDVVSFSGCQPEAFITEVNFTEYHGSTDLEVTFGTNVHPDAFFSQNGIKAFQYRQTNSYFFIGRSKFLMSQFIDQYMPKCLSSNLGMCFVNIDCTDKSCNKWSTFRQNCKV